jgi:hypothetical protein
MRNFEQRRAPALLWFAIIVGSVLFGIGKSGKA